MASSSATEVTIEVAGLVCALRFERAEAAQRLANRYRHFLKPGAPADVAIKVHDVDEPYFVTPAAGDWVIDTRFTETRLLYKSYMERGYVELASGSGELELIAPGDAENFLRVVYAWLCLRHDSLLLHASGMIRHGLGYAFFGHSGAGKTTTTRLSASQATILSDDLVIVSVRPDGCVLHGVPFRGEFGEAPRANGSAPLQAIFRLRQDKVHQVEPLSRSVAVAELGASAPFVNNKAALSAPLIALCHQIVQRTQVHALRFKNDADFWRVIDEHFASVP